MNSRTGTYSFLIGMTLLLFTAGIVLSTSILFLLGISVSVISFWLSAVAALSCLAGGLLFFVSSHRLKWYGSLLVGLAVIVGSSWYTSANMFDLSFDGQTYHQEAIILLKEGWNPVHDSPLASLSSKPVEQMDHKEVLTAFHLWINHYAKGPWMLDAVMYKVTNQIETGKVFNSLLLAASFFLSLAAMLTAFPTKKGRACLLSFLAAFNPVVITQATSYYIDGQLGSLILIICALGYLLFREYRGWVLLTFCASLMLLAQIKFTALVYAVLLGCGLLVLFYFYDRQRKWKSLLGWLSVSLLITVLIVGFNPYVTNTLSKGHPFYPLSGKGAVDIMTSNSPHNFKEINALQKLGTSLLSKSENIATPNDTSFKWPFTVTLDELQVFSAPDVRIAGMGPLFGGALIIGCLILLLLLVSDRVKAKPFLIVSALLLLTVLINPESWWARYVPQLWLIPLLLATAGWEADKRVTRYASTAMVVILAVNMLLVGITHNAGQVSTNNYAKQQLQEIKNSNKTLIIDFHHFSAIRIRLQEAGIPYVEQKIEDKNAKGIVASRAVYLLK
ncbi:hypothetical protein [Brevibacillus reuszeri]|uniref:hypothetical protein n=1 Tax=Brevibacillus reuszeri TaxID=54915 RepID=UPI002896F59B|nr:hypothetical protein [Brevibacillus reuszeri]